MTATVKSIPSDRVAILFLVMLVSAAGNTAMQSALPAIASQLDVPDFWVSLAFSWSALLWVMTAPRWARQSDRRGRKALMSVGVIGFVTSMGFCGLVLWLGLNGYIGPAITFIAFAIFRSLYGGFGSAAPPAVQAYIAARTEREERAKALTLLASSFGLGTVIGPALAHFLVFEPFGLAGPLVIFAAFGLLVLLALRARLPNDTPRFEARGTVASYPNAASMNQSVVEADDVELPSEVVRLDWLEARLKSWMIAGLLGGHAQAIMLGVVGFLVRDRLGLHDLPKEAVEATGSVMFVGAMATLLAQWGLIPMLNISSRNSVLWGSLLALLGIALVGVSFDYYGITLGFAIASLGFGLYRPGFTTGASLAVKRHEQGDVAGKIASINGSAYIISPAIGVALFNWWEPASFILIGAGLLFLIIWGRKALSEAQ
jgi:MFS family permease